MTINATGSGYLNTSVDLTWLFKQPQAELALSEDEGFDILCSIIRGMCANSEYINDTMINAAGSRATAETNIDYAVDMVLRTYQDHYQGITGEAVAEVIT